MCILSSITDEEFKSIVKHSYYINEVVLKCGYKNVSGLRTRNKIKKRINDMNLDISHFKYSKPKNIKDLCIENGKYHRGGLKRRLIKAGILKEECYICKLGKIWQDKPLTLQLDHINGKNTDNRISNLRLLCPNCHSQTSTFSGRKNRKFPNLGNSL